MQSTPISRVLVATLISAVLAQPARSQTLGFESLFKEINDVSFFRTCWQASGQVRERGSCKDHSGFGIEVSYDLGKFSLWGDKIRVDGKWQQTGKSEKCKGSGCEPGAKCTGPDCETTLQSTWTKGEKYTRYYLGLDFALSYSQFSGFKSADTSYTLTGTVREAPGVSLYFSFVASDTTAENGNLPSDIAKVFSWLNPYIGIRTGLLQLSSVQVLDPYKFNVEHKPDSLAAYTASATVFQYGVIAGISVDVGAAALFVEYDYTHREFPNPQWSATGTFRVPPKLNRPLDFTGSALYAGVQVRVRGR